MRAFVSVEIKESGILDGIRKIQAEFADSLANPKSIRLVDAGILHFTLQFLGEIPDQAQMPIAKALSAITFEPFDLEVKGVGAFPNSTSPKVVWVGANTQARNTKNAKHGNAELANLAQSVTSVLNPLGYRRDKPFKPHSTIFRVKMREQSITERLSRLKDATFGTQTIDRLNLKKSQLTPKGPIYTDLAVIKSDGGRE